MAERLRIIYQPYAMPGDVEIKNVSKVGVPGTLESATFTHFIEAAKKALSEKGNFIECEISTAISGGSEAEKFLTNVLQIQSVVEY